MPKPTHFRRAFALVILLLAALAAPAQVPLGGGRPDTVRTMPGVALDTVAVAPMAADISGWLLLDKGIQTELDGAIENLYNFKFDKAEKQFRSLRRRYPQHPLPYLLLGLSTWWKIMPSNLANEQYDRVLYAYMDTTITKAERLYKADNQNYEACFFLSAAHGFEAQLHAERHDWRRATVSSKHSLTYLQKSRPANELSPEFQLGEGLFNYYAVWIDEEYPWLKPVLLFFPKGDRQKGLAQLGNVARTGFYTRTEARFYQMRILGSERENNPRQALLVARSLAHDFPDNANFARSYANYSFTQGEMAECEKISRDILAKVNRGLPGYDAYAGRVAAHHLGYLMQGRYNDPAQAKDYYTRCVVFSEAANLTKSGYCRSALAQLGRLAATANDGPAARRYYQQLLDVAERKSDYQKEARTYLKKNPAPGPPARPAGKR